MRPTRLFIESPAGLSRRVASTVLVLVAVMTLATGRARRRSRHDLSGDVAGAEPENARGVH
jgi:hypothetical protein